MTPLILTTEIKREEDVVTTRQRAKQIAAAFGFDLQDQTRIATAVSEIARNAFRYAKGGKVEFSIDPASDMLTIRVSDSGPGISNLNAVLDGTYTSETGMGVGIVGSRRLTDRFEISSKPGSTVVTLGKTLPPTSRNYSSPSVAMIVDQLARQAPTTPFEEVQLQNHELLQTLGALRVRQTEIERLNEELAATNRGVVALYAELDEQAKELRRLSDYKTRFLSNITHELRTPLNSIIMLARLMISEKDGPLGAEYRKQAGFVYQSAESLLDLVNDLLDLAKIEAGKAEIHAATFSVEELFDNLRTMFAPLVAERQFELIIEPAPGNLIMFSDSAKISQILRNLISNAIKFTEQGEIRVRSEILGEEIRFIVADTGIGISDEGRKRLFQDFSQLRDEYRKGIKGTGLGLSISRQLASLLGGELTLQSEVAKGSTFAATLPLKFPSEPEPPFATSSEKKMELNRA